MNNVLWIRLQYPDSDWIDIKHSDYPLYKTFDEFRLNFIRGWTSDGKIISLDWVVQDERPDEHTVFQTECSDHVRAA